MSGVLLAVDGGNSKADVALLSADGTLLAAIRGRTVSHQAVGLDEGVRRLAGLVAEARAAAGLGAGRADVAVLCLAGADSAADVRALARACEPAGLARDVRVHNDTHAALRAGSEPGWGVAVVLGAGINAVGLSPRGREVRFAALGSISGDRGGGSWLGQEALGASIRAYEGRGPRTALDGLVAARFGRRRAIDVTMALYRGELPERRLGELAPDVVAAANEGDVVAIRILEWLSDEVAAFVTAAIRRGSMTRLAVPVVLAGGVARGADPMLTRLIADRVRRVAPRAEVRVLWAPPVLGAALLALDVVAPGDEAAAARIREALAGEAALRDVTPEARGSGLQGLDPR